KIKLHLNKIGDFPLAKHLYDLAVFSTIKNQNRNISKKLLISIKSNFENIDYGIDNEIKYKVLKGLAYLTSNKESIAYHIEYCNMFKKENFEAVDIMDLEIFTNLIHSLSEKKEYDEALNYIEIVNSKKENFLEENLIDFLVIDHLELNLYYYT